MSLFKEFTPTFTEQWKQAVEKELKGLSFDEVLFSNDVIEDIQFPKYVDQRASNVEDQASFRGGERPNNDWDINVQVLVKDEKFANAEALQQLNLGASSITFLLQKTAVNWALLFENIALDFIDVHFKTLSAEQTKELAVAYTSFSKKSPVFLNDALENGSLNDTFIHGNGNGIAAYKIQQIGANATQELAYALSAGHTLFHKKMEMGEEADRAAQSIHFELGIGSNYFVEIAKFRLFRKLWGTILQQYQVTGNTVHILARTGFVNKSLKDPYTNLLRQTTEAMSASMGGANAINVQPYDMYALNCDRTLSERMAINISHLLKEESYLHAVCDPLGGSYSLEMLGSIMEKKVWSLFQEIEKLGGIGESDANSHLQKRIRQTAEERIKLAKDSKNIFIGINKYPNPESNDLVWTEIPGYFQLPSLIIEKQLA